MNRATILFILLLFAACKKKQQQNTVTHYPQSYFLSYNKEQDSTWASASLAGKATFYTFEDNPAAMKLNGVFADSFDANKQLYTWRVKGLEDAVFTFETHGNMLTNTIKAADVKTYEFVNLADTVSIANWKTVEYQGPAVTTGDLFVIELGFSNNTTYRFGSTGKTSFTFPQEFLQTKIPAGKTRCRLLWYGAEKPLQMGDAPEGGSVVAGSFTDKYIQLVP
jgi:hypothetical protein